MAKCHENRFIRIILTAGDKGAQLRTDWNAETPGWGMHWKAMTIKKGVSDATLEHRIMDVLGAAAKRCK